MSNILTSCIFLRSSDCDILHTSDIEQGVDLDVIGSFWSTVPLTDDCANLSFLSSAFGYTSDCSNLLYAGCIAESRITATYRITKWPS